MSKYLKPAVIVSRESHLHVEHEGRDVSGTQKGKKPGHNPLTALEDCMYALVKPVAEDIRNRFDEGEQLVDLVLRRCQWVVSSLFFLLYAVPPSTAGHG